MEMEAARCWLAIGDWRWDGRQWDLRTWKPRAWRWSEGAVAAYIPWVPFWRAARQEVKLSFDVCVIAPWSTAKSIGATR
jgi:hypothetical protein